MRIPSFALDNPWWKATPKGKIIPLAFIKIDIAGATLDWDQIPEDRVLRRRDLYRSSVEAVARECGAAWPLNWQGDGVMLFLTDDEGQSAPIRAFLAARALWERIRIDLNLSARIGVHAGYVGWNPETGHLTHRAIDHCGHLEGAAPENAIGVSEDVALTLGRGVKDEMKRAGFTKKDHLPAYLYPAEAVGRIDPAKMR